MEAATRLEETIRATYAARYAALSDEERSEEDTRARDASMAGGHLFLGINRHGTASSISAFQMRIPTLPESNDYARIVGFLSEYRGLFDITEPALSLELKNTRAATLGDSRVVRLGQRINGLPVFHGGLLVRLTPTGDIEWVHGHLAPDADVTPTTPSVSASEAEASVLGVEGSATLGWVDGDIIIQEPSPLRLAWRVARQGTAPGLVYIDALSGEQIGFEPGQRHNVHREVFNLPGFFPGTLEYDDICHSSGDAVCPVACSGVCNPGVWPGATLGLFNTVTSLNNYYTFRLGRDGWDNGLCGTPGSVCTNPEYHRMRVYSGSPDSYCGVANYDPAYVAAPTWNDTIDLVSHETAHLMSYVEEAFSDTADHGRNMNEAFSDAFAELAQKYTFGSTDWLVGEGPPCSRINMANPSSVTYNCDGVVSYPQPDHYSNYRSQCLDPHWNATIISKAAYLLGREPAEGAVTHWGISVTGVGEAKTSQVWYEALAYYLFNADEFSDFRTVMPFACQLLSGSDYTNCVRSVDALGIWSPASILPWYVDRHVAPVAFSLNSQARWWVFYKGLATDNNLYYRYKTCEFSGGCPFTTATAIAATLDGPTVLDDGSQLWICYRSTGNTNACKRLLKTGAVVDGPHPGGSLVDAPSMLWYGSRIWLAYRKSNGAVYTRTYNVSWAAETSAGFNSSRAPVLSLGPGGSLYVVYGRTSDNALVYRKREGSSWGPEQWAGQSGQYWYTAGRPAATQFLDRLHLASTLTITLFDRPIYGSCGATCNGQSADWTRAVDLGGADTYPSSTLDASSGDGKLYLWQRRNDNVLFMRYKLSQ